ncbi:MAG TPA: non-homologous end-joining DNA ligase [Thermoanaerobaculia bacterium]|nr:non-homologous end-joining DNA ligase [Thermoanaerobaculia bacterium]
MPRLLFPSTGFTTADAAHYYRAIAKVLLPHLRDVPLSFKRYPDTIEGESFWEKDAPSFTPKFVQTFCVPRRSGPDIHYILANDVRTLTWLAESGGIELHPFLHRVPHIERATSVVFDLDPGEGASIVECCEVALLLRDALAGIGFESFAKVSGSKGLQVYVPLNGDATHDATEAFARVVAEEMAKKYPALAVAKMAKQLRARKVLIDWSQNADFKTTVSVYSLRAKRERPYVSMPVKWDEVASKRDLDFQPPDAIARLKKIGDLFAPVLTMTQQLPWNVAGGRLPVARKPETENSLPKPKSQSGRRLFVMPNAHELWLEMGGEFHRWTLQGDRATPAGRLAIEKSWYRGEGDAYDIGAYELIEGSYARDRFALWFTGRTLNGEWLLEKLRHPERSRGTWEGWRRDERATAHPGPSTTLGMTATWRFRPAA